MFIPPISRYRHVQIEFRGFYPTLRLRIRGEIRINEKVREPSPFIQACKSGNVDAVKAFLTDLEIDVNEADQRGMSGFVVACMIGEKDVVDLLKDNDQLNVQHLSMVQLTPLTVAASNGCLDIVRELLSHENVQVNPVNQTIASPLVQASYNGHLDIVNVLLGHPGIDPNQLNDVLFLSVRCANQTAFMIASCLDQVAVVEKIMTLPELDINAADMVHRLVTSRRLTEHLGVGREDSAVVGDCKRSIERYATPARASVIGPEPNR
ncbi:hypothetical protein DYB32_004295 [Aphanomyces invadans]|uniref:Uncharacterized protein n=1 Tax=Aphanomyces invadans TaxID=157072 RepID=A0A3R6Y9V5_9STRA|nr:hypothetical protein DYB32_004295 [Aphanomyces invadans]